MGSKGKPRGAGEVIERVTVLVGESQSASVTAKPPPYERRVVPREEKRSGNFQPTMRDITVQS